MIVRVATLCTDRDLPAFQQGLKGFAGGQAAPVNGAFYRESRTFLEALRRDPLWDLLIVADPGARGMETVISARELAPETPLVWCSDDDGFAVASYRLRCELFLQLPLGPEQVQDALRRCLIP